MTRPVLCIPIDPKTGGGLSTFVTNLTDYLDEQGWPYTRGLDDRYDVLFVNSWVVPYRDVRRLKRSRPSIRVVHRVDGSAQDYGRGAASDAAQARVNMLADLTIFQSDYARFSVTEKFSIISGDGPVIHNPVDVRRFSPDGPRVSLPGAGPRVVNVSWSTNRRKGTWRIQQIADEYPTVQFILCGRYEPMPNAPNVVHLGHLDRDGLANALRAADLFLDLSENDACPNVVLEAIASGLPVAHVDSGAVAELAGEAGLSLYRLGLSACLARAAADDGALGRVARARAVEHFSPPIVFSQYLDTFAAAARRVVPGPRDVLRLARAGFPVLPPRVQALRRVRFPRAENPTRPGSYRVGWITYDSFPTPKRDFRDLDSFTRLRGGTAAEWLNANDTRSRHELYRPGRWYDVVVFQKMMDARCQVEARRIQASGGRVVFDANVNYYETWGDYFIPGTQPTAEQQRDAIRMTRGADWVIADSTFIAGVAEKHNRRVSWIPDSVDLTVYHGTREHRAGSPVRLIWSGVGKKAAHLLEAIDALAQVKGLSLTLVSDAVPDVLPQLERALQCRFVPFTDEAYARELLESDIIISPKRLVNGYEMGHTEYKIALGMAVGLPAIASPQPSYVEALAQGGGVIATTATDWRDALARLAADPNLRATMGRHARETVLTHYATDKVAPMYATVFDTLLGLRRWRELDSPQPLSHATA